MSEALNGIRKTEGSFCSNGEKINYILYKPDRDGEFPAVIFHPGNRLYPYDYEWLHFKLVESGYIVFAIYQRGFGSGTKEINDRAGAIQQQDLQRALHTLKNMEFTIKDRIGLIGHSNGAGMSLRLAAEEEIIKCVVSMSMISDWGEFVKRLEHHLPKYYNNVCDHLGGSPVEQPLAYEQRSCIQFAHKIKIPVLFVSGEDDAVTPTYQSTWMHCKLKENDNHLSELYIIPGVGHFYEKYSFSGYKTEEVGTKITQWIQQVL